MRADIEFLYGADDSIGRIEAAILAQRNQALTDIPTVLQNSPNDLSPELVIRRIEIERLLEVYSIIELARLAGYVPDGAPLMDVAQRVLEDDSVRAFFLRRYPRTSVSMLNRKPPSSKAGVSQVDADADLFEQFVNLHQCYFRPLADGLLLRLIDDWDLYGWTFDAFLAALDDPEKIVSEIAGKAPLEVGGIGLKEASQLLDFCGELAAILRRTKASPEYADMVWGHFGYWFETIATKFLRRIESIAAHCLAASEIRADAEEMERKSRLFKDLENTLYDLCPTQRHIWQFDFTRRANQLIKPLDIRLGDLGTGPLQLP